MHGSAGACHEQNAARFVGRVIAVGIASQVTAGIRIADEQRVKLYLDGVEQTRDREGEFFGDGVRALPSGRQTKLNLGRRFGNWFCDCAIDELTIYGRALTPKEVAAKAKRE